MQHDAKTQAQALCRGLRMRQVRGLAQTVDLVWPTPPMRKVRGGIVRAPRDASGRPLPVDPETLVR